MANTKLFLMFFLIMIPELSASQGALLSCADAIEKYWVPQRPPQRIDLELGPEAFFPGAKDEFLYIDKVHIKVAPRTPQKTLRAISRLLAKSNDEELIFQKLLQHRKSQEPLPLQDLLPLFARERTNTRLPKTCEGVNCFSAAMNWFFPEIGARHLEVRDFENNRIENFDRVYRNQDATYGDLIIFRFGNKSHIRTTPAHAAVYLDKDLIWNKHDQRNEAPFSFSSLRGSITSMEEWGRKKFPGQQMFVEFYRRKKD